MDGFITSDEFDAVMHRLAPGMSHPKIAVAVSGGGDSLALTLLMQQWIKDKGGDLLALTVDHKLRPESRREAEALQETLCARGICHEILTWQGEKPATHIQERARQARYDLLLEACRRCAFPVLAVAHNMEDQIETFWMRLAHGSGLDGLAAMASARNMSGIAVIRPLLAFSRDRLRATCVHFDAPWTEDPSNSNEKFLRVRLRQFEALLEGEGLTPSRLALTVQKLEDARQALQSVAAALSEECVTWYPEGYGALALMPWKKSPADIQRRVLALMLSTLSPKNYAVGFESLEQTRLDLHDAAFAGKSLAGCEIVPGKKDHVLMLREMAAVDGRVPAQEGLVWDGRFLVSGFHSESFDVGAVGEQGLSELRKKENLREHMESLPFKVRRVLPALWRGENLLAVPHLSYYSPDCPADLGKGRLVFYPGVKIV